MTSNHAGHYNTNVSWAGKRICWCVFGVLMAGCSLAQPPAARVFGYKVVRTYPHDTEAYTQGLVYQNGFLYEGTGLNGRSGIRRVNLATGKVLQKLDLDPQYFGEGITLWRDKLIQLTWQSRIGFVYDRRTFRLLETFVYRTEGWGLTHDGKRLIQSDGTATLYFFDPQTLKETGQIQVTDRGQPKEHAQ